MPQTYQHCHTPYPEFPDLYPSWFYAQACYEQAWHTARLSESYWPESERAIIKEVLQYWTDRRSECAAHTKTVDSPAFDWPPYVSASAVQREAA